MIEPTDEMLAAFLAAWDHESRVIIESDGDYVEVGARDRAGLAAVLAIVERDYRVNRRVPLHCGQARPDGITCMRTPDHDGCHAWALDGELVKW